VSRRPHVRVPLAAAAVTVLVWAGCGGGARPAIVAGVDGCAECGMVIDQPREAAGYVRDSAFVTFDSPLCLLRSVEALARNGAAAPQAIYFGDFENGTLHPAETVTFLLTQHVSTTMGSGVLPFADRAAAERWKQHDDEIVTDWAGVQILRGEPDRELLVTFGPAGMVPDVVEVAKGELVLWKVRGAGLERDLVVSVKGYPEVGSVVLPASGEEVVFRLRADHPGAGFPIVAAEGGEPLGMLKVSGAHTADEEES